MLFMLLSLSLGWSLASAHSVCRYSHLRSISQKPAAQVVFVLGILQVGGIRQIKLSDAFTES